MKKKNRGKYRYIRLIKLQQEEAIGHKSNNRRSEKGSV